MEAANTPAPEIPQADDAVEDVAETPVEAAEVAEASPDTPDAADELERLRSENALYESLMGDSLAKSLGLEGNEPVETPVAEKKVEEEVSAPGLLEPMDFTISEEEEDAISVGDAKVLRAVLDRRAKVTEHNMNIQMNAVVAKGIMWYLPVALATKSFSDRNPEFVRLPDVGNTVGKLLTEARVKHPNADEAFLVRHIEKRLEPALKRVKQIVSEAQKRRELGQSQSPAAKQPTARAAAPGGTRQPRVLSGTEEAALLIEKMATRY